MARLRKPEDETQDEAEIRRTKEIVSNKATRNEKVAWDRKMNNMVSLLAELTPIEEQLLGLITAKTKLVENIQELRGEMVLDCVHPFTHLVFHDDHVVCKFCDRKFKVMNKHG